MKQQEICNTALKTPTMHTLLQKVTPLTCFIFRYHTIKYIAIITMCNTIMYYIIV